MYPSEKEFVHYIDDAVEITNKRAVFWGKTYSIASISSVRMAIEPPDRSGSLRHMFWGTVWLVIGSCIAGIGGGGSGIFYFFIGGGVLFIVLGVVTAITAYTNYAVVIGVDGKEDITITSKEREPVERVVMALSKAIGRQH